MRLPLCGLMLCLLLRAETTMAAASAACRLFATSVMPGLFPYMVLSLMVVSRMKRISPMLIMLMGWCSGSPTGARLLQLFPELTQQQRARLAVSTATMSPMFLMGTVGGWLHSPLAGMVCLVSVIVGGWLAGCIAGAFTHPSNPESRMPDSEFRSPSPLSFGDAVEQSARTMLLVCGTMVMLRVFAALAGELLPSALVLPLTTLLEVTTGASAIAALPLPLPWRTALIAGATGFGGMAIVMQNRAVMNSEGMSLGRQILWQAVHGGISFLIALGWMWLLC